MNTKNVLFITYYWPPAGGASVNRTLKFAKYLGEFGWQPHVLTVEKGDYHTKDQSLVSEISPSITVYRSGSVSFFPLIKKLTPRKNVTTPKSFTDLSDLSYSAKLSRFLKANIIPDTRIFWLRSAIKAATEIIKTQHIDLIFTSSPPQTNHLAASSLIKRSKIPWIADFRDPWNDMYWNRSNSNRLKTLNRLDKYLERRTLEKASLITTIGPTIARTLQKKTQTPIEVIYNGYDQHADQKVSESAKDSPKDSPWFTLLYAGSMSYHQRPAGLFRSLEKLKKEGSLDNFRVVFMGEYGKFLSDMIRSHNLGDIVSIKNPVALNQVPEELNKADLLLVLGINECDYGVIPSKLFEYLASKKPVLGYGLEEDASNILKKSGQGKAFLFHDPNIDSAAYIKDIYLRKIQMRHDEQYVNQFHRRELTRQLASLFDDVLKNHQTVP